MSSQPNRPTTQARCSKAIAGADKHFASVTTVSLRGIAWKPADIDAALHAAIDAGNTADTAKATWQQAVKAGTAARTRALALLSALKAYLVATKGSDAVDLLADFGFAPPKPKKVTVKTKAAAVQKTAVTRVLRHTMGKKQRKLVKGPNPPPATTVSTQPGPSPVGAKST
ncbi:MAG: hypothetical protein M3O46_21415 [Myxococcota bacterium]|nr:hypothetical protein [Myxococcota bacterium]